MLLPHNVSETHQKLRKCTASKWLQQQRYKQILQETNPPQRIRQYRLAIFKNSIYISELAVTNGQEVRAVVCCEKVVRIA